MKNHDLLRAFDATDPIALVRIKAHEELLYVGKITWLVGQQPIDTITEATREPNKMNVSSFCDGINENGDPTGDAQIFIRDRHGEGYAYYDIARVRHGKSGYQIIIGAFRTGGG